MKFSVSRAWLILLICATGFAFGWIIPLPNKSMPPGYILQTDGEHWRFIALEQGSYFTNYDNGLTRKDCVNEAWKIYRMNRHTHEWRTVE